MSRLSKILSLIVVLIFLLACNFVTQPIQNAQDLAETAQSVATLIPVETLQALPSALPSFIPEETLQALPSAVPTIEALGTEFTDALDPQGTPLQEWNGIPIMSQATAGEESGGAYTFKVTATAQEIQAFYDQQLPTLGWSQSVEAPVEDEGGFLFFEKEGRFLTIFIMPSEGGMLVFLTLA